MSQQLLIDNFFRRNGKQKPFSGVSIVNLIVLLTDLRDGLKKGQYMWASFAYGVLNKHDSLTQLDFMHKRLIELQNLFSSFYGIRLDVLEEKDCNKFEELLWENILLNDNIASEVQKINRDYYFWDELKFNPNPLSSN